MDGDFTACDTATLNRFFADYLKAHTQGGTNTLQRNLAHLFEWLDEAYDHPSPYSERLHLIARPFDLIRLMGWTETLPAPAPNHAATSN